MKQLVAIVTLAWLHAAAAGPLEELWQTKASCANAHVVPWRGTLAWLDHDQVHRVDRATGKVLNDVALDKRPLAGEPWNGSSFSSRLEAAVGDDLVVHEEHTFAIVDGTTGAVRWRRERPVSDGGPPFLMIGDGDVIWIHPSHAAANDPPVFLERLALATGARVWRADTPQHSGQVSWAEADARRLYVATEPSANGGKFILTGFELATGKQLWSIDVPVKKDPNGMLPWLDTRIALVDGSLVYAAGNEGAAVIDGATGKQTAWMAEPAVSERTGAHTIASDAGRVFVVTSKGDVTSIVAFDLAHRTRLWTTKTPTSGLLAAGSGALYEVAADGETLRALDQATGVELAWYGVGGSDLVFTPTDAGAPVFVGCDGGDQLTALDPLGTAVAPERATITGQLSCRECGKGPFRVHVGTASTKTDAHGRFKLVLEARGVLDVKFDLPRLEAPTDWAGADGHVVRFTNRRRYDLGTVRVTQICGPHSGPC